jgi:hypothetical protein
MAGDGRRRRLQGSIASRKERRRGTRRDGRMRLAWPGLAWRRSSWTDERLLAARGGAAWQPERLSAASADRPEWSGVSPKLPWSVLAGWLAPSPIVEPATRR